MQRGFNAKISRRHIKAECNGGYTMKNERWWRWRIKNTQHRFWFIYTIETTSKLDSVLFSSLATRGKRLQVDTLRIIRNMFPITCMEIASVMGGQCFRSASFQQHVKTEALRRDTVSSKRQFLIYWLSLLKLVSRCQWH